MQADRRVAGLSPTLETERLILRPLAPQDFDAWAAFAADAEVMRFLGGPLSREASWRGFMVMAGAWAINGFAMFSVIEKTSGAWLGRIGPWRPEGWPGPEVGWGLAREAWGKGYALEASAASIDWAFEHLGWSEVIHSIHPDNAASQAVARKLGSTNRGPGRLPDPLQDERVDLWGQTREQWAARRATL